MRTQKSFINKVTTIVLALWTFIYLLFVGVSFYIDNYNATELAYHEADVSVKKDISFRLWAAKHGGVYVPVSDSTPPNPYLSHIERRDINTSDGQNLTLMNPAYIIRQVLEEYETMHNVSGHLTSSKLLNPINKPDRWEQQALNIIERTEQPHSEIVTYNGEEHLRYIRPFKVKESCMKCHAHQGYKVGDVRGGISVAIPMKKYYDLAIQRLSWGVLGLSVVWIIGILSIIYGRKAALKESDKKLHTYEQHLFSMVNMIEKRDSYTAGHTQRVAEYSVLIAKEMGYNEEDREKLFRACMLHDIGKISTPDSILLKPGKLSTLEYDIIKEHVVTSYELLKGIDIYHDIAEIVRHHHERYDGHGYPLGLYGDEIPEESYIMMVADAFDAMTTNRIYKARKDVVLALQELEQLRGSQFHPEVVDAAVVALKDIVVNQSITQKPQSKLEQERFAYFYSDPVTGVYNRDYLDSILSSKDDRIEIQCIYGIYLHNFSQYNKEHGWNKGDIILKRFAHELQDIIETEYIFRVYGDDFVIIHGEHFPLEVYEDRLAEVLYGTGITFSYEHIDTRKTSIRSLADLDKLL